MPSKPTRKTKSLTEAKPSRSKAAPKTRRATARGGKATPIPEVVEEEVSTASATQQEPQSHPAMVDPSTSLPQPTATSNIEIEEIPSREIDPLLSDPLPSAPPVAGLTPSGSVARPLPTPKPMSLVPPKMITSHRQRHIPARPSPLAVHRWSPESDERFLEQLSHEVWLRRVRIFNKNPNLIPCVKPGLIDCVHLGFIANHVECAGCARGRFEVHDAEARTPKVSLLLLARENGLGYPVCYRLVDLKDGRTRRVVQCELTKRRWAHDRPRMGKDDRIIVQRCVHYPAKQPNSATPREPNVTVLDFERRFFRVVLPPEKAYVKNDPRPLRRHGAVFLDEPEQDNHALDLNSLPPAPLSPLSDSDLEVEEYPSDSEDGDSSEEDEEAEIEEVDVSLISDALPDSSPPWRRGGATSSNVLGSQPQPQFQPEASTSTLPQHPARSESPVPPPSKSRKGKGKAKAPPPPEPSEARPTKRSTKPVAAKASRGGKKRSREAGDGDEVKEAPPSKRPRRQAPRDEAAQVRGKDDAMEVEPSAPAVSRPGPPTSLRRSARLASKNRRS